MIEPGEIYVADFEEGGPRPVIVISRGELNRGRYALVVPCTSAHFEKRSRLPNCVAFQEGQFGLTTDCVAQCENIASVDLQQLDRSAGPIGVLDGKALREVIKAIGYVLASDCELV
jgi:mRNA-degrading endonuclease toxin of MazEF toxin-antitoxin module